MAATVTVVVVNWNGAHLLRRCLPGVLAQELSEDRTFDVVVVDNASTDDSLEVLAGFPDVRVVRNSDNLGFAGGVNHGVAGLTTPYVALVNNDAIPEPGWLEALLAPFEQPGGDELAVTTSRILLDQDFVTFSVEAPPYVRPEQPKDDLGIRIHSLQIGDAEVRDRLAGDLYPRTLRFRWTRPSARVLVPVEGDGPWPLRMRLSAETDRPVLLTWRGGSREVRLPPRPGVDVELELPADAEHLRAVNNAGVLLLDSGQAADRGLRRVDDARYAEPGEVFGGCGGGMAVRTEVAAEAGWFDDRYFLYYEDVDLSWRLRARGWRVRYVPDAVVRHEHMGSSGGVSELHDFHDARNRLLCLTTNATSETARREVREYRRGMTAENRALRRKVLGSYARLLPHALRRRREVARTATVSREQLEALAVSKNAWRRGED